MGALPAQVRDLALSVKAYERATIEAVQRRSWGRAVEALNAHPLIPSAEAGARIAEEMRRQHRPLFDYLA
jgi:alpha-galactosidase/6-phospho-beta-glucosidase family protein